MPKVISFAPTQKSFDFVAALQAFVLVDLLFFPRLLFAFGIPSSMLIVVFSLLYRPLSLSRMLWALLLFTIMLASVTYGAVTGQNLVPEESLKRAIQLFSILLYSFFRLDTETIRSVLVKVLRCFYVWTFCTMLFFFLQPDIYKQVIAAIYPETLDQLENTIEILRFSYFYSDPNSAAYLICFTLVAYLFLERKLSWGIICSTMAIVTILATQSRGAYFAAAAIILYFSVSLRAPQHKRLLVIGGSCLVLWSLAFFYSEEIEMAYSIFDSRFEQEQDLGGGRSGKYHYFVENFNFLPIGSGYHLRQNGEEFRPHSDLIRINLSYGVLALPLLLYFVFPRRKSQALLFVVFLVPFLINTVIDDYRLFGMYLLLFGILGRVDSRRPANNAKPVPVI
jgi:hypothetical protein